MSRQALIVLGMHRSGTSALTGALQRLGVRGPNTAMPGDESNLLGYGESETLVEFNDRILDSLGSRWDAWARLGFDWLDSAYAVQLMNEGRALLHLEFGDAALFVVKDPRLCRLVPFWLRVMQAENIQPAAIVAVRSPFEVARSLEVRNQLSREQSLLIWLRHVMDAEFDTRNITRSFIRYDDLLEDWKMVMSRLSTELGVTWPDQSIAAGTAISDFLRPELRHHCVETAPTDIVFPLSEWIARTWEGLGILLGPEGKRTVEALTTLDAIKEEFDRAASIFGPIVEGGRGLAAGLEERQAELREQVSKLETDRQHLFDRIRLLESERGTLQRHASNLEERASDLDRQVSNLTNDVSNLTKEVSNLTGQVSNLEQHNAEVSGELAAAKHHVEALLQSGSWRITTPLRAIVRAFKRASSSQKV